MIRIICAINENYLDEIRAVNTGHIKDGKHLYRIQEPASYNHLEIYHNREEPWHILAEKILNSLNKAGYNQIHHDIAEKMMQMGIFDKEKEN